MARALGILASRGLAGQIQPFVRQTLLWLSQRPHSVCWLVSGTLTFPVALDHWWPSPSTSVEIESLLQFRALNFAGYKNCDFSAAHLPGMGLGFLPSAFLGQWWEERVSSFFFFLSCFKDFTYLFDGGRGEKENTQADGPADSQLSREPEVGLDPRTLGSWPEPKANI